MKDDRWIFIKREKSQIWMLVAVIAAILLMAYLIVRQEG